MTDGVENHLLQGIDNQKAQNGINVDCVNADKENDELLNGTEIGLKNEGNKDEDTDSMRTTWGGRFEFLLSVLGFTVGYGNIWRFPNFVFRNGGGVAFIPYIIFVVLCGTPLYYIEVCLGQFSGKSPQGAYEICPLFKGIGVFMATVSGFFIWYLGLCFGWVLYYLVYSFYPTSPWGSCNNDWNTNFCFDKNTNFTVKMAVLNMTNRSQLSSSAEEFWEKNVLAISSGFEHAGSFHVPMFGCVVASWIIVFLCLFKGVKSLGKVLYVTATMPFLLLTVLVVRGVTLDGASEGLKRYLNPDFSKLFESQVWIEAAVMCFFSLGPAWGPAITMASFNKFNHKITRDTIIVCVADTFMGFYSGLVVFSVLGFLSKESGTPFDELPFSGASLAFIAYPEALNRLPWSNFWSVLFFLTLTFIGVDTQFGTFETTSNVIIDTNYRRLNKYRTQITALLILLLVVLDIPFCMSNGYYLFMLTDWYVATFNLVAISLLECVIVGWIYGAARFSEDIALMQGTQPPVVVRYLWCFVIPVFLVIILLVTIFTYSAPTTENESYSYPAGALVLGNVIAFAPLSFVLVIAIYQIYREEGSLTQRLKSLTNPSSKWLPNDEKLKDVYRQRPYKYQSGFVQRLKVDVLGMKA